MITDRKIRKRKKGRHYYSIRYPGDPVWNPLDHLAYILLDEKDSTTIDHLLSIGYSVVAIEKSKN